jgi:putative glutamine amidotransferase
MHTVTFQDDLLGYHRGQAMSVAARHHQAVKKLAKGFKVIAHSDDGIIEAISGNGHFGIQWHPESDESALQIYSQFVSHCQKPRKVSAGKLMKYVIRRRKVSV